MAFSLIPGSYSRPNETGSIIGEDNTFTLSSTGIISNFTRLLNESGNWKVIENVAFDMETVYLWVILVLGFPGNCATVVTVIKMSPARSLTVYIVLLAIVDNLAIISKIFMFVLLDKGVHVGQFGCKILGYCGNFLGTFANWLLVGMSVERFAAVWFPFKVAQMWSSKKSLLMVVAIFVTLTVLFLHLFWTMGFVDDRDADMIYCSIKEQYRNFAMHTWYWINVCVYALLPGVLLIIFNVLIVNGISNAGKASHFLKNTFGKDENMGINRHRQITIMLVMAALTLIVLITPRCVMLILTPYWTPRQGTMEGAIEYLLDTIAFVLCDFTHAVNFYVYSLSAERFRRQFLELFVRRKNKLVHVNSHYISLHSRTSLKITATRW